MVLLLNLVGMIMNCWWFCIVNLVVCLYVIDIEKNKESIVCIGIDLGGIKIEVIVLGDVGEQLYCYCLFMSCDDYWQIIEMIVMLVDMVEQVMGQCGMVGMGIPGLILFYIGVVKNVNLIWFNGQLFDKDLSVRLQWEVWLVNDVNCLVVLEVVDGVVVGVQMVFVVIIGMGCGVGVVFNGWVYIGGNGMVGEWGYNLLLWMDEDELCYREEVFCYCGK